MPNRVVVRERLAPQTLHALPAGMTQQSSHQRGTEADSAPTLGDYQSEFSRIRIRASNIASLGDEKWGCACPSVHFGDQADVPALLRPRELAQQPLRYLLHQDVEPEPPGEGRERSEEALERFQICRPDWPDPDSPPVLESCRCACHAGSLQQARAR